MRQTLWGTVAAVLTAGAAAAGDPVETTLTVKGMFCDSCRTAITRELGRREGIAGVAVDLKRERVTVRYDPAKTSPHRIAAELRKLGYDPR